MDRIINNRIKTLTPEVNDSARRPRRNPMVEGSLKEFGRLFIAPFIKYKSAGDTLENFLDNMFCVNDRTIERYKCLTPFRMPGNAFDFSYKAMFEYNYQVPRNVQVDQIMWIRKDITMPGRIDIELIKLSKSQKKSTTFRLRHDEYQSIIMHCTAYPYKCHQDTSRSNYDRF